MGVYGIQNKAQGTKRMNNPYALQGDEARDRHFETKGGCQSPNLVAF